jgi:hypothetical protein
MILKWFQCPLLLLVSHLFLRFTCAVFLFIIIIIKAVVVEIQRRRHSIEMKKVVIGMEVVRTQMKVEGTIGNGTVVKIVGKEETDGGVIMIILRGEVAWVTVLPNGKAARQMMTMQGQEEAISHGV